MIRMSQSGRVAIHRPVEPTRQHLDVVGIVAFDRGVEGHVA